MSLPLQQDLQPPPPWFKRVTLVLVLGCAVLLLGWISGANQRPATLLVTHGADASKQAFVATLIRQIDQADTRVWVMLYVLRRENSASGPVSDLVDALARAQARGCSVAVVLDVDKKWRSDEIDPKHEEAAAWLKAKGVSVVLDDLSVRTHAKVVLIDHTTLIIGSHNWTWSALSRNRETSVMLHDPLLNEALAQDFASVPGWDQMIQQQ